MSNPPNIFPEPTAEARAEIAAAMAAHFQVTPQDVSVPDNAPPHQFFTTESVAEAIEDVRDSLIIDAVNAQAGEKPRVQLIEFAEDVISDERRMKVMDLLVPSPMADTLPVDDVLVVPEPAVTTDPDFDSKKAFVEQMLNQVNDRLKAKGVNVGKATEIPITGPSGSPELNTMFADLKRIQREFPKIHGRHVRVKKRKSKRDKKK